MNEEEILRRLKIAYESFTKSNISEYQTAMREAKVLIDTLPERGTLYGEWILLTYLPNMWDLDKICEIFKEALKYIQGYSCIIPRRAEIFGDNCSPLASLNQIPGHADENGAKLHEAVELFCQLTGGSHMTDACYRAQLAQDRGDFETARQEAFTVFAEARHQGREMNALNAAELLAQQGKYLQDEKQWSYFFGYIQRVADGTTPSDLATRQQAEIISTMLLLSLGLMVKLPEWVEGCENYAIGLPEGGFRVLDDRVKPGAFVNALILEVEYYTYRQEPIKALNVADMIEKVFGVHNSIVSTYLNLFRSVCYRQLNMEQRAEEALTRALEWIAPDGLWLLAAEFEPGDEELMRRVASRFSPEAAAKIHQLGENFWEKLEIIRKSEEKTMPEILTKREQEIVQLLTDYSNSEIAQILHISDKTVKRHVENIYAKLGINRRGQVADAVRGVLTSNTAFWVKK